ncbi:MAG: ABC transporter ATP-binding protein [Candidatus Omnitrophica bacterium]|nr:ABC transporter ATP-binding protein [Candidatus Omnitrophota bacterium]
MQPIIKVKDLYYSYKDRHKTVEAIRGIDLEVNEGEIFGFIGPNGAGKTTTIKLLLGILIPQTKDITICSRSVTDPEARRKVGYMPETANYYRYLTPIELLTIYGKVSGVDTKTLKTRIDQLIEQVDLENDAMRLMGTFSKGMMQKVSFAQALVNDPDLLILDEPTGGLDPVARMKMRSVILRLKAEGKTVFFSSHELSEVELICDRIGLLAKGKIVSIGAVNDVLGGKASGQSLERYFLEKIGENT